MLAALNYKLNPKRDISNFVFYYTIKWSFIMVKIVTYLELSTQLNMGVWNSAFFGQNASKTKLHLTF